MDISNVTTPDTSIDSDVLDLSLRAGRVTLTSTPEPGASSTVNERPSSQLYVVNEDEQMEPISNGKHVFFLLLHYFLLSA